jgi:hypothetical protein
MSIFGALGPRIYTSTGVSIDLDHMTILKNEPETKSFVTKNNLTGLDGHVDRGYHWVYEIRINLFKYANAWAMYYKLLAALGTEVTLIPCHDHTYFKDSDGTVVYFLFSELQREYLTDVNKEDALRLKFISMGFVDISKLLS